MIILFMALVTAIGAFMCVILFHSYKEYRKLKLIRRLERQMVAPRSQGFSLSEILGYNRLVSATSELLSRAGLTKLNAEDTLLSFFVILTLLFSVLNVLGMSWLSLAIPAIIAVIIPWLLGLIGTARHTKLNRQFGEAVQDMADYLKLVPNLENAIRKTAETAEQPLRGQLEKILRKIDLGTGLLPALKDFSNESESIMIDFWVDSIVFAYRMRASVADVCEDVSKKIRQRMKQNAQVSTKLTEIKTMMFAIAGVMVGIMFFIFSSSPEFSRAFDTVVGKIALIYTIVSYAGSTLYILRRINREVSEL